MLTGEKTAAPKVKARKSGRRDEPLALPFVKDDPAWARPGERGPRCYWSVKTTGSTQADCELGEELAGAALDYIRETGEIPLLGRIVMAIAQQPQSSEGDDKMIMIAFMEDIARHAMYGRYICNMREGLQPGETMIIKHMPKEKPVTLGGIKKPAPLPSIEIGTASASAALLEEAERVLKRF